MKKAITAILLTLFLASMLSMAFMVPVEATPDSGIVGLWHFDEGIGSTASDSSGYGNDGTLSGGKFGNALDFDGDDDYVLVPDDPTLRVSTFTLEAWIYPRTIPDTWPRILHKGNYEFDLYITDTNLATNIDGTAFYSETGIITLHEWQHVAVTCDGEKVAFYRNNVKVGEHTTTKTASPDFENLYIGNRGDLERDFDGVIDEVRISNIARTSFDLILPPSVDVNTVGLWHFDESVGTTAYDSSGNDNRGTIHGAKWAGPTWTTGKFGTALSFDGDDYVEVPSTSTIMPATLTVEAWVKPSKTGARQSMVSKWDGWVDASYSLELTSANKFLFYLHNGMATQSITGTTVITPGTWYHVAATYDGAYARLYVNGILEAGPTALVPPMTTSSVPLRIGASAGPSPYPLHSPYGGVIDEVRIWNRVLTAEEIKKHAWGLVGEWGFNEGTGTTAYDTSGFGNDGTLNNFAPPNGWVDGRFGKALSFDGVNDFVEIQPSANLDITDAITVEAWIKADLVGGTILRKGAWPIVEPPPTWGFDIQNSKLRAFIYDDGTPYIAYGTTTLVAGGWYHVAFTYDAEDIRIYLNGVEDGSQHHSGDIDPTDAPIWISRKDQVNYFDGVIDEVRIWNQALIPVKFDQTGLDSSATGTVVTVDDPIELEYDDLPYIMMVESGTEVTYTYEQIVSSNIIGKRFSLDSVTGGNFPSDTITVNDPTTITGNYVTQIETSVDIDPDTLNLKSNGQWITAYITLPEGYSVEDIDPETVGLDGIEAVWSEIQNGVFMAKFDRAVVIEHLGETDLTDDCGSKFDDVKLTVTGEVAETLFEGIDTIKVIKK